MHILAILAAIVGGAIIWYVRSRRAANIADGVIDAAQHAKGAISRRRHAHASDGSAITAINDPVIAAATLVALVAGREGWPKVHHRTQTALEEVAGKERAEEAIVFAEWAVRQGVDENRAVDALCRTLTEWLGTAERREVIAMVRDGAASGDNESERLGHRAVTRLPLDS